MLIAKAPPALPLTLSNSDIAFFMDATPHLPEPTVCMLALPNSAGLDLKLLNINATGLVTPGQPGDFQISLYAYVNGPKTPPPTPSVGTGWLIMGRSGAEDIGGPTDFATSQWMIQANNLMYNLTNGKMQGTYYDNIASNPEGPGDLDDDIVGLVEISPIVWFAVGVSFAPDTPPIAGVEVQLATFTLTGDF
jgi:hypothetical protein